MNTINNQNPPKSWLVESILATIFCCLPFGIAGIVNAAKVESKFAQGDLEGAERASANAKKWTLISAALGVLVVLLAFIGAMLGFVGSQY